MVNSRYRQALVGLRRWKPEDSITQLVTGRRTDQRRKLVRGFGLSVGLAGALSIIGVAFILARPAQAVDFARMANALKEAKAVHLVQRSAKGTVLQERWQSGPKWRSEHNYWLSMNGTKPQGDIKPVSGFDGRDRWQVTPWDNSVQIGMTVDGEFTPGDEPDKAIDIIDDYAKYALYPSVERVRRGQFDVVTFTGKNRTNFDKFKVEVTADPETQLPVEQRMYSFTKERTWDLSSTINFDYPKSIDDTFFSPVVPKGFVVYNYREIHKVIESAFAGEAPKQTVNGVTVSLIGALQNEDGQVLVFWKGGAVPPMFAQAAVFSTDGKQHLAGFWYEDDDRTRERNHGIRPKNPPPKIPREQMVVKLRPMGFHRGEAFYCLKFNPGRREPNHAQTYNVVIPVCEQVEPYFQQPTPLWIRHEATGREVGAASFRVTTIPVKSWFYLHDKLDPEHMSIIGAYQATNIGMTKEQIDAYRNEAMKREMAEMMGGSSVIKFVRGGK